MTTLSKFYYQVTMHQDAESNTYLAPFVAALPLVQNMEDMVVILGLDVGVTAQGLYVLDGIQWRFTMPMPAISACIIRGDALDIYYNRTDDVTVPVFSSVYKNGQLQPGNVIVHGTSVYAVRTPPPGQTPAVTLVNGQTGVVTINAANLPGLARVAQTGAYTDLVGLPPAYQLPTATNVSLGGVIVPSTSAILVDGSGNIDLKASVLASISGAIQNVQTTGTGNSLVFSSSAPTAKIKSIAAGQGITISDDNNGTLTVAGQEVLAPATTTALGGVIVPGPNIVVDGSGNIDISPALKTTINGKLTAVQDSMPSSGQSLIVGTVADVVSLNTIAAGQGIAVSATGGAITISSDLGPATNLALGLVQVGNGLNVTLAGLLSLAPATATTLGGVIVGAGLSVAVDGTISYVLPTASSSVLGGIKIGNGLSIAGDGTVTAASAVPATATTIGAIIVGSGLSVLPNGTLSVVFPVTSVNTKTGDIVITGSGGIAVDNSGSSVALSLSLTQGQILAALGYTPYDAANPAGYITGNQLITVTGDVQGTGTTALHLTFSPSGVTPGVYTQVTVDARGRVTLGANPTTLAGYGIVDALNSVTGGNVSGTVTFNSGAKLTGIPDPLSANDAANKNYVDTQFQGVANGTVWKANAQVATTANLPALSGLLTIDGYATQAGDRVLVKDQTDQTANGVYLANSGAWTRALDLVNGTELVGMAILVLNGTNNALSQWVDTAVPPITVGTTNIVYAKLQPPPPAYTAGAGLQIASNQFSIAPTGVTPGNYSKFTVNSLGQITNASALTTADISTAIGYTPYNATNPAGYISTNQLITLSGDATGTGSTTLALTLATTGVTPGTYTRVTVDSKGRVTVGANLAPSDILAALGFTPVNKAGDSMLGAFNYNIAQSVASATSTPIGAATSNVINITGTTTINGFDSTAGGALRILTFKASLTLVSSPALILPTGSDIVVQPGDVALFISNGGTVWQCLSFIRADGTPLVGAPDPTKLPLTGGTLSGQLNYAPTVTLAAQGILPAGSAAANDILVTGTATIQYFDSAPVGAIRHVTFASTPMLLNSPTMLLPTGANIVATAGDTAGLIATGVGWRCVYYQRASGQSLAPSSDPAKLSVTGGSLTGALNLAPTVTVASAANTPIGAANSNDITISGVTSIVAFDTITSGTVRKLTFAGSLTLTYNSTSLILPTAANIVTQAGDGAQFTSLGSGNWRCDYYTRANGSPLAGSPDVTKLPLAGGTMTGPINQAPTVNIASSTTVNIGGLASNDILITGANIITSFGTIAAGAVRRVSFNTAATLTYNATSMILPGAANIVTAAGDTAQFTSLGGGNWRCDQYQKANGQAVSGASTPFSTLQEFDGSATNLAARFANAVEAASIVGGSIAAAQNFYVNTGAVQYYTGAAGTNWVWNFLMSSSTTLNAAMAIGDSLTVVGLVTQGSTGFFTATVKIYRATLKPKWLGGAPTSGNANGIDVYTFTIIKTAASTYTVLASVAQFK